MGARLTLGSICAPSGGVIAREIEGEVILVPLRGGVGNADEELLTLNETGKAVWRSLDGRRTLADVVDVLAGAFDVPRRELEADVLGFVAELLQRGIVAARG